MIMTVEEQERYRKIVLCKLRLHLLSPSRKEYAETLKELRHLLGIKEKDK